MNDPHLRPALPGYLGTCSPDSRDMTVRSMELYCDECEQVQSFDVAPSEPAEYPHYPGYAGRADCEVCGLPYQEASPDELLAERRLEVRHPATIKQRKAS